MVWVFKVLSLIEDGVCRSTQERFKSNGGGHTLGASCRQIVLNYLGTFEQREEGLWTIGTSALGDVRSEMYKVRGLNH